MAAQIVLLVPLGELPPGGASQLPIFGQPGRPDQGLPGSGGRPSQPIYHPGHPDHGLPSGGHPDQGLPGGGGHPDQGLPGGGGRPDQGLPGGGRPGGGRPGQGLPRPPIPGLPDQGLPPGTPVPPDEINLPEPSPEHADDLIVAVHKPGDTSWTVTAFSVGPDQGQPQPTPQ